MAITGIKLKPALIVLDIQNVWLDMSESLKESVKKRAKTINEAIAWFRKSGRPIIVVYHTDKGKGPEPGTKAFEVSDMISVKDSDIRVVKNHPNSFGGTGLHELLKKQGCDSILIVGLSANWCVLATFFGAMDWGIDPWVLKGGVAATPEEHVRFAEETCEAITLEKLEELTSK